MPDLDVTGEEFGIPQFKVGDKVLYHKRPYEDFCPLCGVQFGTNGGSYDIVTTIIDIRELTPITVCNVCLGEFPIREGYYALAIRGKIGLHIAAPYTLLEKV